MLRRSGTSSVRIVMWCTWGMGGLWLTGGGSPASCTSSLSLSSFLSLLFLWLKKFFLLFTFFCTSNSADYEKLSIYFYTFWTTKLTLLSIKLLSGFLVCFGFFFLLHFWALSILFFLLFWKQKFQTDFTSLTNSFCLYPVFFWLLELLEFY